METGLDALAERVGIAGSFDDALGQTHETPREKKKSLLRAMELPAEDEAQAEATLADLDRSEWARALPPCIVLYEGEGQTVPVCLPAEHGTVRWVLTLEDGGERRGASDFHALKRVAISSVDRRDLERRQLKLPEGLPWGYHRLRLEGDGAECTLIVTPGRCWLPGDDDPSKSGETGERFWGIAAQMYLLRSERNWGIGDFSDLRRLVELVREQGGDAVGVNPLHGMFPDMPEQSSPYSPLSRYLLNALNIDVEAIPEFAGCAAAQTLLEGEKFRERLARARAAKMVAYEDVAALKMPVLQAVFAQFERTGTAQRKAQFAAFQQGCDDLVRTSCLYAAIRQYLTDQDEGYRDLSRWPEGFRHARSEGVSQFSETHAALVQYQLWLQWVADEQLGAAKAACAGMAVGIYRDLAVGASPSGAEVWSNPGVMVAMAEVGAPPDILNTAGQNWALPPFHPQKMREDGYRGFIALLRANMRHAGGLRIDHAMALQRLFWIPRGGTPEDGGYVNYPIDDLVGVIALESQRARCLVVGEDLGTVAAGFRERMAEAKILSYKVLLLEEDKAGGYVDVSGYPRLSLSTASSHDLPTLRGWWEEVDLDLRERLGLAQGAAAAEARREREKDRASMLKMFRQQHLLEEKAPPATHEFIDAAHGFLARTAAVLMMAQLEDLVKEPEQVNLPASTPDQYPSWSRRVAVTLEDLAGDARLKRLANIVSRERSGNGGPTRT